MFTDYLVPLYASNQAWTGLSWRCISQVLFLALDLDTQASNLRGSTFLGFRCAIFLTEMFHPAFVYFLFNMKCIKLLVFLTCHSKPHNSCLFPFQTPWSSIPQFLHYKAQWHGRWATRSPWALTLTLRVMVGFPGEDVTSLLVGQASVLGLW